MAEAGARGGGRIACPKCGSTLAPGLPPVACPACLLSLGLHPPLAPGTRLGPYAIVAPIASGGMGEVYRARDERLKRDVAVKVLPSAVADDPERLRRFEQEAQAASALNHPNIVAIYDVGSHDGSPYMVSELLEGQTLRTRLARGPLVPRQAIEYATQIARGLAAAHAKGIVHRDLKPENVFVTNDDHVKILDFGLAKLNEPHDAIPGASESRDTQPGMILGTIGYMSPEQVKGRPADHRSDIFSFGAVLYEMLSGRHAFRRETAAETISAILKEDPPELSGTRPDIDAGLDRIVRHCLQKDPNRRFQSANDLVFSLTEPSSPFVSSGARPPASPVGRRRIATAVGVGALVVLAAAGGLLLRQARRSAEPRRIAVLPFENLGASEDAYLADGIADEVRSKLTNLPGIEVIARASSMPYRKTQKTPNEIARELGVRYLLTATVRWTEEGGVRRVHVIPELVETRETGAPTDRWQQAFDASMTDVFLVQGEIATRVAQALNVALGEGSGRRLSEKPTQNMAAYESYLKGEELWNGASSDASSIRRVLVLYEQAVEWDPGFARAWSRVAQSYSRLYLYTIPSREVADRARQAAENAREGAPEDPAGFLALGDYELYVANDPGRALEQYETGRRAAPGDADLLRSAALAEKGLGRWEAAVEHFRQAVVLDPRSASNWENLAVALIYVRRYPQAREACDRGLAMAPGKLDLIEDKAATFLMEGNLTGARDVIKAASVGVDPEALIAFLSYAGDFVWVLDGAQRDRLVRLSPSDFDDDRGVWALCLAQAYALRGDAGNVHTYADEARRAFEDQVRAAPGDAQRHVCLGLALAYLGRKDDAIREGERGVALDPVSRDAENGPYYQHQLVRIYALLGEPERALDHLEPLLKIPAWVSTGLLRIDPNFEPLRTNPRFQRLATGS